MQQLPKCYRSMFLHVCPRILKNQPSYLFYRRDAVSSLSRSLSSNTYTGQGLPHCSLSYNDGSQKKKNRFMTMMAFGLVIAHCSKRDDTDERSKAYGIP